MAKKSSVNIPAIQIIRIIVFLFLGFLAFAGYSKAVEFLTTSELFDVHDVAIDASLQFVDISDLQRLKGRNIFKVDIRRLHNRIKSQYPQVSDLTVRRELPDRLRISAKKREALFQTFHKGKTLLVDADGVAMYYISGVIDLPMVQRALPSAAKVTPGGSLPQGSIALAVRIIRGLKSRPHTAPVKLLSVNMANLSKIDVAFNGLHVILDQDNYTSKLDMLEMLLAQKKIDFAQVKYVDLRFNEPVMGANTATEPKPGH